MIADLVKRFNAELPVAGQIDQAPARRQKCGSAGYTAPRSWASRHLAARSDVTAQHSFTQREDRLARIWVLGDLDGLRAELKGTA